MVAVEIDPLAKRTPLVWRLRRRCRRDLAQAIEVVRCYRLRWRIEQVFRAPKSDGLALGRTQLADAGRLLKLAAFALCGAVRTIQLVDARDGGERPASDVAGEDLIAAAAAIGPRLQGKTQRQQNPHPPASLAGWPGSSPVSAAGTATTSRPAQRPCATAGTSSPLPPSAILSEQHPM